jgi:acylglycerol lipase
MRTLRRAALVSTAAACLALAGWVVGTTPYAAPAQAAQSAQFPMPDRAFRMRDGYMLPARIWPATPGVPPAGIILALHGFTDSRDAWEYPAPAFSAAGYTVIAPDQRGFGATATRGTWAGQRAMVADAAELASRIRAEHPGERLILMGESMGGAVTMCLAASAPATADAYVVESPAVWGRAEMEPGLRVALWAASSIAPAWRFSGGEVPVNVTASDNREALLRLAHDPLTLHGATMGMLRGLVDLMDSAQDAAALLPPHTLVLNGRRDQVVPQAAIAAAWDKLPTTIRRGFYLSGFHLLFRDTARALPTQDTLAWLANPAAWLPSGADINAAAWQADHAWQATTPAAAPATTLDAAAGRNPWPY